MHMTISMAIVVIIFITVVCFGCGYAYDRERWNWSLTIEHIGLMTMSVLVFTALNYNTRPNVAAGVLLALVFVAVNYSLELINKKRHWKVAFSRSYFTAVPVLLCLLVTNM